jgi:hypothetical protein
MLDFIGTRRMTASTLVGPSGHREATSISFETGDIQVGGKRLGDSE